LPAKNHERGTRYIGIPLFLSIKFLAHKVKKWDQMAKRGLFLFAGE
jgi:hypothetical protein